MKWVVGIILFIILSSLLDEFNYRTKRLEERMSKLEEVVGISESVHQSDEDR